MNLIPDTKYWLKLLAGLIITASLIAISISIWTDTAIRGVL